MCLKLSCNRKKVYGVILKRKIGTSLHAVNCSSCPSLAVWVRSGLLRAQFIKKKSFLVPHKFNKVLVVGLIDFEVPNFVFQGNYYTSAAADADHRLNAKLSSSKRWSQEDVNFTNIFQAKEKSMKDVTQFWNKNRYPHPPRSSFCIKAIDTKSLTLSPERP